MISRRHWFIFIQYLSTHTSRSVCQFFISLSIPFWALEGRRVREATLCSSSETTSSRPSKQSPKLTTQIDVEALIAHVDCILIPHYHANYISLHAGTSDEAREREWEEKKVETTESTQKYLVFPRRARFFAPPLKSFVSAFFSAVAASDGGKIISTSFASPLPPHPHPDNLFTPHSDGD